MSDCKGSRQTRQTICVWPALAVKHSRQVSASPSTRHSSLAALLPSHLQEIRYYILFTSRSDHTLRDIKKKKSSWERERWRNTGRLRLKSNRCQVSFSFLLSALVQSWLGQMIKWHYNTGQHWNALEQSYFVQPLPNLIWKLCVCNEEAGDIVLVQELQEAVDLQVHDGLSHQWQRAVLCCHCFLKTICFYSCHSCKKDGELA